jgi:hypothetical protein
MDGGLDVDLLLLLSAGELWLLLACPSPPGSAPGACPSPPGGLPFSSWSGTTPPCHLLQLPGIQSIDGYGLVWW